MLYLGASFADATLYGNIDQTYNSTKTTAAGVVTNQKTNISAYQMGQSFLGVKGEEDLGGGLKASYFAIHDPAILKKEKLRMEAIINTDLTASRNSFSKLNLPETYRNLIELEIQEDFTMGYVNQIGFRAGTCSPFLFYDLDYEVQTPLKIWSYHIMDYCLLKTHSLLDKKKVLVEIINEVKKVLVTFMHLAIFA